MDKARIAFASWRLGGLAASAVVFAVDDIGSAIVEVNPRPELSLSQDALRNRRDRALICEPVPSASAAFAYHAGIQGLAGS
jgi:hypothetical protein